jgi:hypothetical protein
MRGGDLEREIREARNSLTDAHREMLVGIAAEDLELVGAALIRVGGELYEPDPAAGRLAFITPVRLFEVLTPEAPVPPGYSIRLGDIVDIVAWHPGRPDRWALRTGAAEWLGAIEPQYMDPSPVHVRRSVLSWFQGACDGLLPLSRSAPDMYRLLTFCTGGLIAEDDLHAAELRRVLERPWSAPSVSVARQVHRAAA